MNRSAISRILLSGTFLAATTVGISAMAQATAQHSAATQQAHKAVQNAAQNNEACQRIVEECKKLGFVVGEWKTDNGVWADCFDPVVHGGKPTRDGKPIEVPVSASDLQTCRAAVEHAKRGAQKTAPGAEQPKQ